MYLQKSIGKVVKFSGIGLHTGKFAEVVLKPAPPNHGIIFYRKDIGTRRGIDAKIENVLGGSFATVIGRGKELVITVEHILSAIFALGIDNLKIEVFGEEIPAMDGSAHYFLNLLKKAGIVTLPFPKKFILIEKEFKFSQDGKFIEVKPSEKFIINYTIEYRHPLINLQSFRFEFSEKTYEREISKARTFGFLKDVEYLRSNGYALGGSLENAIVLDEKGILNREGLRYKDEFVRHKILDALGDLSLSGMPIIGEFFMYKTGHLFTHTFLKKLFARKDIFRIVEYPKLLPKEEETWIPFLAEKA